MSLCNCFLKLFIDIFWFILVFFAFHLYMVVFLGCTPSSIRKGKKIQNHTHTLLPTRCPCICFFALLVSLSFFCSSILICRCAHVSLASFSESPNSLALAAHCLFSCHTLHLPCDDAMPSDSSISRSTRPFTFWHQLSLTLWLLIQIEKFQLVDYW